MKRLFIILFILLAFDSIYPQYVTVPVEKLIPFVKESILPIICKDSTWNNKMVTGTAVLLTDETKLVLLTCEHVVAIKDSNNKTIRYASNIFVNMNLEDSTVIRINAMLLYADEKNDFAILAIVPPAENVMKQLNKKINAYGIRPLRWTKTKDIQEGESILYIGYPMSMGIGYSNYPISRIGIIAQLIKGKSTFLIDGFVQHGHSGSPVFVIKLKNNAYRLELIGICAAFPDEFTDIYKKVKYEKIDDDKKVLINPGFTFVTSMDNIIPVLVNKFGFIK
jgi:hypothetical protein